MKSIDASGDSIIVVRCDSGLASAAAVKIDAAHIPEILGTIAGDDTIFVAVRDIKAQRPVIKKIWEIFEH